nr:hypothetical protein Q903MT_gene6389 [Picea sitchensis]
MVGMDRWLGIGGSRVSLASVLSLSSYTRVALLLLEAGKTHLSNLLAL